ncbi:MAG: hypothetical protein L0221_02965 [Chloroflexi bacterium]|nr:hypothetical protein [Chloroflexota bacterium]
MPFIEVRSGGASDIPDGVYPVILVDIKGPKTVTAQRGPNAGQDIDLLDWIFAVDQTGHPLDGKEIEASSSTASGPRSKMYAFLTALFNGVAPLIGAGFEKTDLVGRRALATVKRDEDGWPRLVNLGAMPTQMQQAAFAQATGAPTLPPTQAPATGFGSGGPQPAAPLREAVAAGTGAADDPNGLPF